MAQVAQVRTILLRSTLTTSLASSHLFSFLFSLSPACPNCQHGTCRDTLSGNGTCSCNSSWIIGSSVACDTCATGLFGSACSEVCPSCNHGTCNSGVTGNGQCTCATGWANNGTTPCIQCQTNYFFNETCEACDSSCATCSGISSNECLSCTQSFHFTANVRIPFLLYVSDVKL